MKPKVEKFDKDKVKITIGEDSFILSAPDAEDFTIDLEDILQDIEISHCQSCGADVEVLSDTRGDQVFYYKDCEECGFREEV